MRMRGRVRVAVAVAAVAALPVIAVAAAWPLLAPRIGAAAAERLRQETGRPWRIGGLGIQLDDSLYLVLRDLALDEAGTPAVRIGSVRVADPLALALGLAPVVRLRAEDVVLRLPIAAGAAPLPDWSPHLPRSVRAVAGGLAANLVEADRTLAVSVDTLDLTVDPERFGSSDLHLAGATPAGFVTLALALPAGESAEEAPFRIDLEPHAGLPRVEAAGRLLRAERTLRLDAVSGRIDRAPFTGSLVLSLPEVPAEAAAKPRLALDLRLAALAVGAKAAAGSPETLVLPARPELLPDPALLARFDASATLAAERLDLGPARLGGVRLAAALKADVLDVALTAAEAYEGSLRGRYVLTAAPAREQQISLSLNAVRVLPALSALTEARGLDGTATGRLDLRAPLGWGEATARAATGLGEFAVTDGRIDGLGQAGIPGLLAAATGGLRFDRLGGAFRVAGGQAATEDMRLSTAAFEAEGAGGIDLVGRSLDIGLKPLRVAPARPGGRVGRLDVPVRIHGPWEGPAVTADLSGLARDPAGTLQTLQDLGAGLLGEGGLLEGLLPGAGAPRSGGRGAGDRMRDDGGRWR